MVTGTRRIPLDTKRPAGVGVPSDLPPSWQLHDTLPMLPRARVGIDDWRLMIDDCSPLHFINHQSSIINPCGNLSPAYHAAKRLLDVLGALALLVVLGPLMLAVFLILLATTRGKPLFWQRRAGYCGRPFWMLKFRTMVADAAGRQHEVQNEQDGPIFKNRHDPRITRLGRLLRKTSLDETPQLFHVLFGRMSLVGPRPLPLEEAARLDSRQRRRMAVVPGLTCLWQISGRNTIGFQDWVRLDLWYVHNQGLWTDLKLLLYTPASVLSCRGAY